MQKLFILPLIHLFGLLLVPHSQSSHILIALIASVHLCDFSLMSFPHYSVDFSIVIENGAKLGSFIRFVDQQPFG